MNRNTDFSRNIKILTWHSFFTDLTLWSPIAILYFAKVSGSFTLGLSVFAITMVSSALLEIPTGIFSDLIGRKRTVILGSIFYTAAIVTYAIGGKYLVLVLGALFEGMARSFYSGNNDALLYESLQTGGKSEELSHFLGKISSMSQWALATGAMMGSLIASFSFQAVIWMSVVPQVACIILALNLVDQKARRGASGNIYAHLRLAFSNFKKNIKLRWLTLSDVISFGVGEASFQFQSAFIATLWPIWAIGMSKVLSYVGAAMSFSTAGKVIRRIGEIKTLLWSGISARVISFLAYVFPGVWSPLLISSLSVQYGWSQTAKSTLLQREFSDGQRATMGSMNSLGGSVFFGIYALCLGLAADKFGPAKALIMSQALLLTNILIYLKLFDKRSVILGNSRGFCQ